MRKRLFLITFFLAVSFCANADTKEKRERKYIFHPASIFEIPQYDPYKMHVKANYSVKLNVPMILQNDNYSCATTSLAMVMSYYDNTLYNKDDVWNASGSSIEDVTQKCGNDMNGLKRAAQSFGFTQYEFVDNLNINKLKDFINRGIPPIVNIKNFFANFFHAVVVVGYDQEGFFINDPAWYETSSYHIDYETFKTHWYAHLCTPTSDTYYNSAFILYNDK